MKNNLKLVHVKKRNKCCKDIWNSFMYSDCTFDECDIPFCNSCNEIPKKIIRWSEAVTINNAKIDKCKNYHENSFVCFYLDDYRFDGIDGIWYNYQYLISVLKHFDGAITPDFSTYADFPDSLKRYNTCRMRVIGHWLSSNGIKIINNVRWSDEDSYCYSFAGLPKNSILAIGSVGGNPWTIENRSRFENGLYEMYNRLKPHTLIVYGSAKYPCFKVLEEKGVNIISFDSETAIYYSGGKKHV